MSTPAQNQPAFVSGGGAGPRSRMGLLTPILTVCAMSAAGDAAAEEPASRSGKIGSVQVRIFDAPCSSAGSLAMVKEEVRPLYHRAEARKGERTVQACWIGLTYRGQNAIFVVDEDGEYGPAAGSAFTLEARI